MTEFAITRHGADDWRLVRYDGSEATVGNGWAAKPTLRQCASALMDYHGAGNQPFSSREGTLDTFEISNQWPVPTRDMTLSDETLPWDDADI
jgi:hypothetical protein